MEGAFGRDLKGVRLHTDAPAALLSRQVAARAFTVGRDVFFGAGEYRPDTAEGQHTLAHELAHTGEGRSVGSPIRRASGGDEQAKQQKKAQQEQAKQQKKDSKRQAKDAKADRKATIASSKSSLRDDKKRLAAER
jgi:hypothetical protein